jgi:hypothetical protein
MEPNGTLPYHKLPPLGPILSEVSSIYLFKIHFNIIPVYIWSFQVVYIFKVSDQIIVFRHACSRYIFNEQASVPLNGTLKWLQLQYSHLNRNID